MSPRPLEFRWHYGDEVSIGRSACATPSLRYGHVEVDRLNVSAPLVHGHFIIAYGTRCDGRRVLVESKGAVY